MFRTFRIVSVLLVTSLAIVAQQPDIKSSGTLFSQRTLLVALAMILGFTNVLVEVFDHRRQNKDAAKRAREFETLRFQLSRPILPLAIHATLSYETREESINYAFASKLGKHRPLDKSIHGFLYTLDKDRLADWPNWDYDHRGHLIKDPIGAELTFYKKTSTGYSSTPDLQLGFGVLGGGLPKNPFPLESRGGTDVLSLELHSGRIYLECVANGWIIEHNSNQLLSVYDLRGAKATLVFNVSTRDDSDFETPPFFTQIELKCGETPYNVLELNLELLGKPTINSEESCHYKGDDPHRPDSHLSIVYQLVLPDADFDAHLQQFS